MRAAEPALAAKPVATLVATLTLALALVAGAPVGHAIAAEVEIVNGNAEGEGFNDPFPAVPVPEGHDRQNPHGPERHEEEGRADH